VSTGGVVAASWGNDVLGDLTILQTTVGLLGVGTAMAGSAPAAGTPVFYFQSSWGSFSTNSGATGNITFPTPFPNGLMGVWLQNAEAGTSATYPALVAGATASGCSFYWAGAISTSVSLCWLALGF